MIYFLTVNYFSKALIQNLITSITRTTNSPYSILIVNNSPQESAIHDLQNDRVTVIESGDNLGFGRACNLGIEYIWRHDKNSLIWLINPDALLDPEADSYIYKCFEENPDIAILGTQIRLPNGDLWFSAGGFNRWTGFLKHTSITKNSQLDGKITCCQWVTGCSLIINLKQFQHYPTFDPHYFLYSEDADLCVRYAKQGYKIAVTNQVLVTHNASAIIGRDRAFMYQHYTFSRLYFLKQHATLVGLLIYITYILIKLVILLLIDSQNSLGRWQGIIGFLETIKYER
ncbi:glycosyltransferase family 2 protein [Trichothermofontia sichuanensis B231]|uniref:glycosyltransferase family 2 protein n=1 Tax=Trichothermofontia sichuanensis TaxID=3045816 RepID=UPI0022476E8E|nr:glycosyltransferase family 2 protein [Trichothermofontia sichuanensis]UZQ55225.1 glycosyltransferase family 2 protein [Trichothermofontia sichuanensis B231]